MDKHAARKLNRMLRLQRLRTALKVSAMLVAIVGAMVLAIYSFLTVSVEPAKGVVHSWTLAQSSGGTAPMIVWVELPDQSIVQLSTDRQRLAPVQGETIELDKVSTVTGRVYYRWRRNFGLTGNSQN